MVYIREFEAIQNFASILFQNKTTTKNNEKLGMCTPVIKTLGRQRQMVIKFETSLAYLIKLFQNTRTKK